jgi:hypothetical protein
MNTKSNPTTVSSYEDGIVSAEWHFERFAGTSLGITTKKIDETSIKINGVDRKITLFENYVDSLSNYYYYFEVISPAPTLMTRMM